MEILNIKWDREKDEEIKRLNGRVAELEAGLRERDDLWRAELTKHVPNLVICSAQGPYSLAREAIRYALIEADRNEPKLRERISELEAGFWPLVQIAADLLDHAEVAFSNHGSNDYELEYTTKNQDFLGDMLVSLGYRREYCQPDENGMLYARDDQLMTYCASKLREIAALLNGTQQGSESSESEGVQNG